jgi:hypothetical protein
MASNTVGHLTTAVHGVGGAQQQVEGTWIQAADPSFGSQWAWHSHVGSPVQNPGRPGVLQLGCAVRGLAPGGRPPVWTGGGAAFVPENPGDVPFSCLGHAEASVHQQDACALVRWSAVDERRVSVGRNWSFMRSSMVTGGVFWDAQTVLCGLRSMGRLLCWPELGRSQWGERGSRRVIGHQRLERSESSEGGSGWAVVVWRRQSMFPQPGRSQAQQACRLGGRGSTPAHSASLC